MKLARTLTRLTFLAAIGHQITAALVEGSIFEDARRRVAGIHPNADQFVRCRLCVGTWVGLVLAAVYRPNLLADVDDRQAGPARQVANLAGDAVLIALGAGVWDEVMGRLRPESEVKPQTIEAAEDPAPAEEEQAAYPGISIRPRRFGISR